MEKLNQEYIVLLSGEDEPSERFWALEKRIKEDKNKPGVRLQLRKSEMDWDMLHMMRDGAFTIDDLDGFSEELKEEIISKAREFGILK